MSFIDKFVLLESSLDTETSFSLFSKEDSIVLSSFSDRLSDASDDPLELLSGSTQE